MKEKPTFAVDDVRIDVHDGLLEGIFNFSVQNIWYLNKEVKEA